MMSSLAKKGATAIGRKVLGVAGKQLKKKGVRKGKSEKEAEESAKFATGIASDIGKGLRDDPKFRKAARKAVMKKGKKIVRQTMAEKGVKSKLALAGKVTDKRLLGKADKLGRQSTIKIKNGGNPVRAAIEMAKTVPTTGFSGAIVRNRRGILRAGQLASRKEGGTKKAAALGKGLLKVAAGVDPGKGASTKSLAKKAAKNTVKRVVKDVDKFSKAASNIPGPVGSAVKFARSIPTTGFSGALLRNRRGILRAGKHAAKQKGIGGKASALGKGLLRVAAGQDPKSSKKSTGALVGKALKNTVSRVRKDFSSLV